MTCPKCRASNREDARFCRECGTTFGLACSSCGAEVDGRSKFCDRCGAPVILASSSVADPARFVSPASYTPKHLAERILTSRSALEGERKQVTVLFADAAGFSTLSERLDPEAVHTIMDGCFDLLLQA